MEIHDRRSFLQLCGCGEELDFLSTFFTLLDVSKPFSNLVSSSFSRKSPKDQMVCSSKPNETRARS
jgi:hypothetical protein